MKVKGHRILIPLTALILLVVVLPQFLSPPDPGKDPEEAGEEPPSPPRPESPPPDLPEQGAILLGQVHGEPEPPGAGAWIALVGLEKELVCSLDDISSFRFDDIPPGRPFDIWLGPDPSGTRVVRLAREIRMDPGERRTIDLHAPGDPAIRGVVTDAEGKPLAGVRVAVLDPEVDWRNEVPVAATTRDDGRFYIGFGKGRLPGRVRLVVDHVAGGYILEERVVAPPAKDVGVDVEVKLARGLMLAGTVLDGSGRPVPYARVHILEEFLGPPSERRPVEGLVNTDEAGRFCDDAYRPGVYRICIWGEIDGKRFGMVKAGVAAGTMDLKMRFRGFGSAEFLFEDAETGEPVELESGDLELVFGHTGEVEQFECWADLSEKSEVTFDSLPEGHFRVHGYATGYEDLLSDLLFVEAGKHLGPLRFKITPR